MKRFEEFRQLVAMFFAPRPSVEEWIQEVAEMYAPPDGTTYEAISDLEYILSRYSDDQIKEIWNSSRPQIVLRDPAEIRSFLQQTLMALKRVASRTAQ